MAADLPMMQIAWECNSTLYREGFHGRDTHTESHFAKSRYTKQFHRKLSAVEDTDIISQLGAWNYMVQELVVRKFKVPSDRFAAISGIATALETPALGAYFAGVWERNPFLTMAWYTLYGQDHLPNYRSPSWSWEWTNSQLLWPSGHCNLAISAGDEATWRAWSAKWGPRLVGRNILLESSQSKGRVLEGTSMTISGQCRYIFIEEELDTKYDDWGFCVDYERNALGMKVHPDRRPNNCGYKYWFCEGDEVAEEPCDGNSAAKYLCVQIVRDRKSPDANPKVYALILEEDAKEQGAYKRFGVVAFDFDEGEGNFWVRKTLKLV